MDANGTRFKVLLGREDWGRCSSGGLDLADAWTLPSLSGEGSAWDARRQELTLAPTPWTFPEPAGQPRLRQADRRAGSMDRYGNWYWIADDERTIRVRSSGSNRTTPFWPVPTARQRPGPASDRFGPMSAPPAVEPARLRGLAVTDDHYLVVGALDPAGLLVFDLRSGGPPLQLAWPDDVPFAPLDLVARSGGGVFVLDAGIGDTRRVWRLDRRFVVEPLGDTAAAPPDDLTFEPVDGSPRSAPEEPGHRLSLADSAALDGDLVAIGLAGDVVVVLDRSPGDAGSVIRLYTEDLVELPDSPRALVGLERTLVVHDIAVVATKDRGLGEPFGQLYVVDEQGDQAFRFPIEPLGGPLVVEPDYTPMRLFGGRGIVATADGVSYDFDDRWIQLVAQRRTRYAESAGLDTEVFDSRIVGCVWHRLLLDGCLTAEGQVRVRAVASDDRESLLRADWLPRSTPAEPPFHRRGDGPERPFRPAPADAAHGTYELLLQAARGRYLRLHLDLTGNRQSSPAIRSLRIYYPRFSYLEHYLPGVYREDRGSAHFLDAFLANFEGTYTAIEDRIANAEVLFDPRTVPSDALDWLARWFDLTIDPGWDDERRRLLVRHAMDLFRYRGTERGMRMALGLAILSCPDDRLFGGDAGPEPGGIRIVERYQTTRAPAVVVGDPIADALPRLAPGEARWSPTDGGAALHQRYGAHLAAVAATGAIAPLGTSDRVFPIRAPAGDRLRPWRSFAAAVLGVVPAATADDADRWRAFLRRRYLTITPFNDAHRRVGSTAATSFDTIDLPTSLPPDGPPLADWFAFETLVLPGVEMAHRFRVMLPVPIGRATRGGVVRPRDARDNKAEQERIARLVELEKPAHTVFDVLSFWLAFRVGEARLGRDTLLDLGSRSADLRPPAVLGSMHVGESVLTSAMADLPDRPASFSGSVDAATRHVTRRTDG